MSRKAASFTVSVLAHILIVGLFLLSWRPQALVDMGSSVPVELVSNIPQQEMAAAPVDPQAVKPPAPAPDVVPEPVPPTPEPKPQPAPKVEPKPEPVKPEARPEKNTKAADKNGLQKPKPQTAPPKKQPSGLDLDSLSQPQTITSKSKTRTLPSAAPRETSGLSQQGSAPQDMGPAYSALKAAVQANWSPCNVAGANTIVVLIRFRLSASGRVVQGPDWVNETTDSLAVQAAAMAKLAIKKGEPYTGLPDALYNRDLPPVRFDPIKYCRAQG